MPVPRLRPGLRSLLSRRAISTTTHTVPETAAGLPHVDLPGPSQPPPSAAEEPQPQSSAAASLDEGLSEVMESRRRRKVIEDLFGRLGSTRTRDNTFQPHHSLHRPVPPKDLALSSLVAAGAHIGHASALLRPAFLPYAYGTRAGITVIDLQQTLPLLQRAAKVTRQVAMDGGAILFVGTNESLKPAVLKAAKRMGRNAYQLSTRWKPGTLTNAMQVFGEQVVMDQNSVPDLVVILNPMDNMVLIKECCAKSIPTIGIVDSNVDPRIVTYAIPANDDSVRTAELIVGVLSMAGKEGIAQADAALKKQLEKETRQVEEPEQDAGSLP